jgi:hypothetical protein
VSVTTSAHRRSSFQPEYTLFTLILLACCRRREAERDLGILNSPTYGHPHLASVLTSILPKDFHPGPRAAPGPPGLFRSPCHGDRALIVNPLDPPQNGDRTGPGPRKQSRMEGGHANASET